MDPSCHSLTQQLRLTSGISLQKGSATQTHKESAHILVTILVAIEHSLRVVSEKLINACILVKSHSFVHILVESNPEQSSEVLRWLERYKLEREEKTPSKTPTKITQKRYKTKKREIENENTSSPLKKPKFRKDLSNEMEQQENVELLYGCQWLAEWPLLQQLLNSRQWLVEQPLL
uniref:Uncharacterized protein n=1 Tax=Timema poppense TaxID=170557 RepID=A0A7R9CZS2_TIMPO|nr:unnamed protein product [Timema poppensis]